MMPGIAHGLLTLLFGVFIGFFCFGTYIASAWGLHWVVACG
jgi:membrane protein required for beta-lactamase induction